MSSPEELRAWGVAPGYWDVAGHWTDVPAETVAAVFAALGAGPGGPPTRAPLVTAGPGGRWPELPAGTLLVEQGGAIELAPGQPPPPDLPFGYHHFELAGAGEDGGRPAGAEPLTIAFCPSRCPSPLPGRKWGWSAQLYATRSTESWGMGDFGDLGRLVDWAVGNGATFVLSNPLHAAALEPVPEPSPYSPSSRSFLSPLYIKVEDVPGANELPIVAKLAGKARALNADRLIDRPVVWALKSEALEALFAFSDGGSTGRRTHLDKYIVERGKVLDGYTTFCALAERYGHPWQSWPGEYDRPDRSAVARFAANHEIKSRKRYHAWLQWICEAQLDSASRGARLMSDLAVGVDGGGADAWLWQDAFASGMHVGAPPDEFNIGGQDWGLMPWDPWKLRACSYEPYIQTLRSVLRPACGLRLDHVMGLFRLFWVPIGMEPARGTYVRYPWQDLLSLLCLEAWRAGAYVVGEDLGTVEDHARDALREGGVLSYKLFWFEPRPPADWPDEALGAVTTHDLPTIAGVWSGRDLLDQRAAGVKVNEEGSTVFRRHITEWTGIDGGTPMPEVVEATYGALADAPCALLSAALDDALAVEERPNMPGTIDEWPNWCLALPAPLEDIEQSALAAAIAQDLNRR
jgi:4-alpha-glucanotransferase